MATPPLPSWYAIYTRSRSEKQVDLMLRRQALETYLPLRQTRSRRRDRRVTLDMPALPGYLFVRCFLWGEVRAQIKKTPGVIRLVENAGQPCIIPETQIDALRTVLAGSSTVDIHPNLACGDRVEVVRGPFLGVQGILQRFEPGRYKLVIAIEWVNRAVSVEIDPRDVERCS